MKTADFDFDLPQELIAQYPLKQRSDSKLLVYDRNTKNHLHRQFNQLIDFLNPGDLLVFNDSKVIPARLYGHKTTGGRVELLVERVLTKHCFMAQIKASKSLKAGGNILLDEEGIIEVLSKQGDVYHCQIEGDVFEMLEQKGHIPLPPYITRADNQEDAQRYQTIYARHQGSVAAPTAGLHFDEALMEALRLKGIVFGYATLHVGAGTFQPVRSSEIAEHQMHSEMYVISEALCEQIKIAKSCSKRVIAVGTTALRSLESAASNGSLKPCTQETQIFIYPGFRFQVCDALITNFHLPQSTLLMLVSAFIGHAEAMALYQTAIQNGYRFFSYGDASLLL